MPLPELIEIVPLTAPVRAEITVPGSKSITNRSLILAALAEGEVTLQGALWSEDTQIMVECLRELGFMVNVQADANEFCNRAITVYGRAGEVPPGGTEQQPMNLFVGNAGTAARFLAGFLCLGRGVYRLHGTARMHERPQAALFNALRQLGFRIETDHGDEKLPVRIFADRGSQSDRPLHAASAPATCDVSIEESSQFASGLLLCAKPGKWDVRVTGENAEESPYVSMTAKLIDAFPHRGGGFIIEHDASSASYFWASGQINYSKQELLPNNVFPVDAGQEFSVQVANAQCLGLQVDAGFPSVFASMMKGSPFAQHSASEEEHRALGRQWRERVDNADRFEPARVSRRDNLGDSIMTAIVMAPLAARPVQFIHLGRLRVQECERVVALRTELSRCGARVVEDGDALTVYPSQLHGAEIETYNDHRMAMCFAILGLKVPGIKIKNPACARKTFPNFFQKLAARPGAGLGATIFDGKTRRPIESKELFAD